jgi:HEAT repeat protein
MVLYHLEHRARKWQIFPANTIAAVTSWGMGFGLTLAEEEMTARRSFESYLGDLESANKHLRFEAMRFFLENTQKAQAALPHLLKLWNDEHMLVRSQVAMAIYKSEVVNDEVEAVLKRLLSDQHYLVRSIATMSSEIVKLRKASEQDIEFVQEKRNDPNPLVSKVAAEVFDAIMRRGKQKGH